MKKIQLTLGQLLQNSSSQPIGSNSNNTSSVTTPLNTRITEVEDDSKMESKIEKELEAIQFQYSTMDAYQIQDQYSAITRRINNYREIEIRIQNRKLKPESEPQRRKLLQPQQQEQKNRNPESDASTIKILGRKNQEAKNLDQSIKPIEKGITYGERKINVEVDVAAKGEREAANTPGPVVMAFPYSKSANHEIDIGAFVNTKEEARGTLTSKMILHTATTTTPFAGDIRSSGLGLHRWSSIVARPPTLLVAVFPWDRKREAPMTGIPGRMVATANLWFIEEGGVVMGKLDTRKLVEEDQAMMMSGLEAAGGRAPTEVDGTHTLIFPPCFTTRGRKMTMGNNLEEEVDSIGLCIDVFGFNFHFGPIPLCVEKSENSYWLLLQP